MCDTVVVLDPESSRVLFAKNSDRNPNEAQLLEWHPAAEHAPSSSVRCSSLQIPQAPHTHAVLISRPYWMWGAEMGLNEHGVVIGNEAVFTRSPVPRVGLSGMDLVRLALERASTAAQAVEQIEALLDQWPQGGEMGHEHRGFRYHSSFLIADRTEAWVLETSGAGRASERISSGVRAISNALTLPELQAQRRFPHTAISAADTRRCRVQSLAAHATGPADLFALLRDHGPDGGPHYRWHNGAMSAPCMHAGGLLAASQTTGSLVVELGPEGVSAWATGTAAPCTGLFKPVAVDQPMELGSSLWWSHEVLHRSCIRDPSGAMGFTTERDAVEARWLAVPPPSAEAFAEGEALLERWVGEQRDLGPVQDRRPWWVRGYWRRRRGA